MAADRECSGYSLSLPAVPAPALAAHLAAFLAEAEVFGLVETLPAALWLRGAGHDRADLLLPDDVETGLESLCGATDLLARGDQGRAFNSTVEWRWRAAAADGSAFALLGLSEDRGALQSALPHLRDPGADEPVPESAIDNRWRVADTTLFLVGSIISEAGTERAAHTWHEVRNPHPLLYPVTHDGDRNLQPRLHARTYATASHAVRFTRFCSVDTANIHALG